MSTQYAGRHRAARPTRTESIVRAGAVVAATGGIVAAFSAAPAVAVPVSGIQQEAPVRLASTGVAVTAPSVGAPVAVRYGVIGVKAVAKPKPKPVVVQPVVTTTTTATARTQSASRSGTRSAAPTTSSGTTTPTPEAPTTPTVPANGGVLAVAASLSGIPYVYGGTTPAGFDCSGFTSYVFRQVGISLPRTAAQQQAAATPVSSPQPGDLVFFGYPAYHVGIYAGNGMMYDSPRSGLSSGLRSVWSSSATYGRP